MNWTGTTFPAMVAPCKRIWTASQKPNKRHASAVGMGLHFPKISAARAIKPRPAVMLREKEEERNIDSVAPPRPARAPLQRTANHRTRLTRIPPASSACGFSPAKLSHRPQRVRRRKKYKPNAASQAKY